MPKALPVENKVLFQLTWLIWNDRLLAAVELLMIYTMFDHFKYKKTVTKGIGISL